MADFPYSVDIGTSSIPLLKSLADSSGIILSIGSGYRPGDRGLHGQQNAIDLFGSTSAMLQVALYLKQYAPYLLELIHTNSTTPGGGVYVKNGKVVPQSYYNGPDITTGGNIIAGHRDHIHLAATRSGLIAAALNTKGGGKTGTNEPLPPGSSDLNNLGVSAAPAKRKGCLVPATAAAVMLCGPLGTVITMLVR